MLNHNHNSEFTFWKKISHINGLILEALEEPAKEENKEVQQVSGLNTIIENNLEIQKFIWEELGIFGGSFGLANKTEQKFLLLEQYRYPVSDIHLPNVNIPYFSLHNNNKHPNESIGYLIDSLFIGRRLEQSLNVSPPEFYKYLPPKNKHKELLNFPFEEKLRQEKGYKFLYCSAGEISFFIFTWRWVLFFCQMNGLRVPIKVNEENESNLRIKHEIWDIFGFWKELFYKDTKFWKLIKKAFKKKYSLLDEILDDLVDPLEMQKWIETYPELDSLCSQIINDNSFIRQELYEILERGNHFTPEIDWMIKLKEFKNEDNLQNIDNYFISKSIDLWEQLSQGQDSLFSQETSNDNLQGWIIQGLIDGEGNITSTLQAMVRFACNFAKRNNFDTALEEIDKKITQSFYEKHPLTFKDIKELNLDLILRKVGLILIQSIEKENSGNNADQEISAFEALQKLHNMARFPIIPYFFMTALDQKKDPKEHLVFPVWQSSEFKIDLDFNNSNNSDSNNREKSSNVVICLLTLKAFWLEENKYRLTDQEVPEYDDSEINQELFVHLHKIDTFFSNIAKPLIEKGFYRYLVQPQVLVSELRNLSHEIGKQTYALTSTALPSFSSLFNLREGDLGNLENVSNKDKIGDLIIRDKIILQKISNWRISANPEFLQHLLLLVLTWSGSKFLSNYIFYDSRTLDFKKFLDVCISKARQIVAARLALFNLPIMDSYESITSVDKDYEKKLKEISDVISFETNEKSNLQIKLSRNNDDPFVGNLIRIVFAALINTLTHVNDRSPVKIYWKIKKYFTSYYLSIIIRNDFDQESPKFTIDKAFGTKQVLINCLIDLKGKNLFFGPRTINENIVFETSFEIPLDKDLVIST